MDLIQIAVVALFGLINLAVGVRVAVQRNGMPAIRYRLVFLFHVLVIDHKECRLYVILIQNIQQLFRIDRGTVVKGQIGDLFVAASLGLCGDSDLTHRSRRCFRRRIIEAPDTRYYNQFTNKKVTEDKTTRVELKVKKEVEDYTWGEEYYRFTLAAGTATYTDPAGGNGKAPMPDGEQNSVVSIYDTTPDHTLSFGTIRYTRPGTYTYTVTEYDNSKNNSSIFYLLYFFYEYFLNLF